eukprot:1837949-Prymnesium_polylepis.1
MQALARLTLPTWMCHVLYVEYALARMVAWHVGCWQKRRHPWLPITCQHGPAHVNMAGACQCGASPC